MVAIAGGDSIRCAPYAPFGTEELAESAARALEGRRACLLGNHDAIAVGDDLPSALELMVEVEELAATDPGRWVVVAASDDNETVAKNIRKVVRDRLGL